MKRVFGAIGAAALLMVFGATALLAAISGTTGGVQLISAPTSVAPGALITGQNIDAFNEQQHLTLPAALAVDVTTPGTYINQTQLTAGSIPAGTIVSSHFLHFDDSNSVTSIHSLPGSVTFSERIIGVIVQDSTLDASDALLGAGGTTYPAPGAAANRGLELFVPLDGRDYHDQFTVGCDYLSFNLNDSGLVSNNRLVQWVDQIRVITGDRPCASISIVKSTNGDDANAAPGPYIPVGGVVNWTYVVQNTGFVALSNVTVTDNQGVTVTCPKTTLAPSESMTCTASGTAVAGQYANVGSVTGTPPTGNNVTASDPSHYFGSNPKIDITKYVSVDSMTTWNDANTPPGPSANVGGSAYFSFTVVNTGNVLLTNISLTDNVYSTASCTIPGTLAPGASFSCLIGPFPIESGTHTDTGTTTGQGAGQTVQDTDNANYTGVLYFASCTPGYWKNHTDKWKVYTPSQLVNSVFTVPSTLGSYLGTSTLAQGLAFKGGSTLSGAAEILLRASIAALLNTSNGTTTYPLTTAQVISQVNAALSSGDRATMINLGSKLDDYNNGSCPLN